MDFNHGHDPKAPAFKTTEVVLEEGLEGAGVMATLQYINCDSKVCREMSWVGMRSR